MDKPTQDIAQSILHRLNFDARNSHKSKAPIGRVNVRIGDDPTIKTLWIMRNQYIPYSTVQRDITGYAKETTATNGSPEQYPIGIAVSRDAPVGRIINDPLGKHTYSVPKGDVLYESVNKASFVAVNYAEVDAIHAVIDIPDVESRFASLLEALKRLGNLQQKEEELKGQLIEAHLDQKAEQIRQELALTRSQMAEEVQALSRFRNKEIKLRDQPVLDAMQEDIKRSHLLEGGLIISGAPGTGKTTSLIQRIAFLTSQTLVETLPDLTVSDQQILFNPAQNWLFFSPSELLKMYLENAMKQEGLPMSGDRVETWANFRKKLLRAYGWIGDRDKSPFLHSNESGNLFPLGYKALADIQQLFESYLLEIQQKKFSMLADFSSTDLDQDIITRLQEVCKPQARFTTLVQYVQLYMTLQRNFQSYTVQVKKSYKESIEKLVNQTHAKISYDTDIQNQVNGYLEGLNKPREGDQEEDDESDGEFEDVTPISNLSHELLLADQLDRLLTKLYRNLAIKKSPSDLAKDQSGLYKIIEKLIDRTGIDKIKPACLYIKHVAPLTSGIEANLLTRYPAYYKQFRKEFLADCIVEQQKDWLSLSTKDRNRKLHPDEFDFLIWNLHQLFRVLFRTSFDTYQNSQTTLLSVFREYTRAVIAIDEASDFSAVQLQAMASLSYPKFNCVTLSGDLMQRMTRNGITTWDDFSQLWPNSELRILNRAYRQTPVLLDIARQMYREIVQEEPPFTSYTQIDTRFARPLFFQHPNAEEKLAWVVARILEINAGIDSRFPTIALFVEDDNKVKEVYESLKDNDELTNVGLDIDACYNGRVLGDKQAVRIFSVEYIKGMEFEAVFILDIDSLESELLNQYLYVGLTRANYYLGITASYEFPESLRYLQSSFQTGESW